jgi:hypothetical protein
MNRVRNVAGELDFLARATTTLYTELYDASLSQTNEGDHIPKGKGGFQVSDPTGDVAASGMHARMRYQVDKVAGKLRKIRPILEEAENLIVGAFGETDPEFREKLQRLRELEETAKEMKQGA